MKVTLRAPMCLLQDHRSDLETLLRLGAGVNAIESSSRLLLKMGRVGPASSEVDQLSGMLCVCNGLSFFRELVTTIQKENYLDRLFLLAGQGLEYSPIPVSLVKGRELLSPDHPDIGGNPLLRVRDKIAFHWDHHAFRDLLNAPQVQVIDLWTVSGEPFDRVFTASAHAIAQFTLGVSIDDPEEFVELFSDAVAVIGHVLESAFIGLLIEAGEMNPTRYFVKEA